MMIQSRPNLPAGRPLPTPQPAQGSNLERISDDFRTQGNTDGLGKAIGLIVRPFAYGALGSVAGGIGGTILTAQYGAGAILGGMGGAVVGGIAGFGVGLLVSKHVADGMK